MSERAEKLRQMLEREPNDVFLVYALGMEHRKAGEERAAIGMFERVIGLDPRYCYAYHQRGLAYESLGEVENARRSYREGIAAAERKGDAHAAEEIRAALEMIG